MSNCLSCGAEKSEQDRFCRNCGVMVMTSVGDLVDTQRFNPAAHKASSQPGQPGSREFTAPFYAPPAAPQPPITAYQTASLRRKILKRRFAWLMLAFLIASVTFAGIALGARAVRSRRQWRAGQQEFEQQKPRRRPANEDIQNALGFRPGNLTDAGYGDVKGVFVESLMADDGPAALAGIQAGDVLTDLNGQPVRSAGEVSLALDSLKPGVEVPIKVFREGETLSPRVKLGDRLYTPPQPRLEPREQGYLGIRESSRRHYVPDKQKWGVEIESVTENSPADLAGLQRGDVITEFNGSPVKTPGEFNRRIRAAKPRSKASVTYYRGSTKQTVEMTLGYRT